MKLTRYEPWALLNDFHQEIGKVFRPELREQSNPVNQWIPPVDIQEADDHYELRMDIPGVEPDAIDVIVDNGYLVITGERNEKREWTGEGYRYKERVEGYFSRRFKLPDTSVSGDINAKSQHGVLCVTIAKPAEARVRRIDVTH